MKALVTFTLTSLLALPAVSCAQEHKPVQDRPAGSQKASGGHELYRAQDRQPAEPKTAPDDKTPRRLESVTWNSVNHQLTWVISKGEKQASGFKATATDSYEISMDSATMSFNHETRRFSKEEAANVHVLMDVIAKYAVDSTIWWDEGQGEPLNGPPVKDPSKKEEQKKPVKDGPGVLHVALQAPADLPADAVQARIDRLRRQLDQLEQLKLAIEATTPKITRN